MRLRTSNLRNLGFAFGESKIKQREGKRFNASLKPMVALSNFAVLKLHAIHCGKFVIQ